MRKIGLEAAMAGAGGLCLLIGSGLGLITCDGGGRRQHCCWQSQFHGDWHPGGRCGGFLISCSSATITGEVNSAPGVIDVLDIETLVTAGCSNWTITMASSPWYLVVDSGFTSGSSDVVSAHLTDVDAHVAMTPVSSACSFDAAGDTYGLFDEATQRLDVNETGYTYNLTLANVSGCGGFAHDGDPADASGGFTLNVPDGPINIG